MRTQPTRKEHDREMYDKGYRYRCDPQTPVASPYISLYAKFLTGPGGVSGILRDWPTQLFTVVHLDDLYGEANASAKS